MSKSAVRQGEMWEGSIKDSAINYCARVYLPIVMRVTSASRLRVDLDGIVRIIPEMLSEFRVGGARNEMAPAAAVATTLPL